MQDARRGNSTPSFFDQRFQRSPLIVSQGIHPNAPC